MRRGWLIWALCWVGCDAGDDPAGAGAADGRVVDAAAVDRGAVDQGIAADAAPLEVDAGAEVALLARLTGLWSGAASETPLGRFAVMNMDLRAADDRQLFSRFDLDAANNLRFAFAVEDVEGTPTLIYRNGGYFQGLLRDTRAVLVEGGGDVWRFCHGPRGCEYLEAIFTFAGADQLSLVVRVRGQMHLRWPARRLEARPLPAGFAANTGPHDGPFPPLPDLTVTATWRDPLPAPTTAWLLLSTTPCGFTGACNPARVLSAEAPAGATAVDLRLEQVHPGAYHLNVILDRNGNFPQRLFPDRGDGIAGLDHPIQVAPDGETTVERSVGLTVP